MRRDRQRLGVVCRATRRVVSRIESQCRGDRVGGVTTAGGPFMLSSLALLQSELLHASWIAHGMVKLGNPTARIGE